MVPCTLKEFFYCLVPILLSLLDSHNDIDADHNKEQGKEKRPKTDRQSNKTKIAEQEHQAQYNYENAQDHMVIVSVSLYLK
jgi:hypothetical protein